MTRQEGHLLPGRYTTGGSENPPRLRLKPKAPTTGRVDGAWWPHSDDLVKELPDLLAVLSVRLGPIDRVTYNLTEWPKAPARLLTSGRAVRLDGNLLQPANTIDVLGIDHQKILLLVVPAHTDPDRAHDTIMTAAAMDDISSADHLLAISAADRAVRDRTAATEQRWMTGAGASCGPWR